MSEKDIKRSMSPSSNMYSLRINNPSLSYPSAVSDGIFMTDYPDIVLDTAKIHRNTANYFEIMEIY